jgi:uncharacterized membrane protein
MITAGLIFTLLAVLISYLSLRLTGVDYDDMTRIMQASSEGRSDAAMTLLMRAMPTTGETVIDLLLHLALSIVSVGFSLFTLNTIRGNAPVYGNLLDGFGMMPRLLWLLILEFVLIMLWSLLFVIPGIIAAYRYSLAVYVMIDRPELSAAECLRESKRLTAGYKSQLLLLDLSFVLWLLLSSLPVIGYAVQVYLTPYMETAKVLYYEQIRQNRNEWQLAV